MCHNKDVYGKLSLITHVQTHIGKPSIVLSPKIVAGVRGLASLANILAPPSFLLTLNYKCLNSFSHGRKFYNIVTVCSNNWLCLFIKWNRLTGMLTMHWFHKTKKLILPYKQVTVLSHNPFLNLSLKKLKKLAQFLKFPV